MRLKFPIVIFHKAITSFDTFWRLEASRSSLRPVLKLRCFGIALHPPHADLSVRWIIQGQEKKDLERGSHSQGFMTQSLEQKDAQSVEVLEHNSQDSRHKAPRTCNAATVKKCLFRPTYIDVPEWLARNRPPGTMGFEFRMFSSFFLGGDMRTIVSHGDSRPCR